ncbi:MULTISPECIES: glycosyltransferase family 2 protein [Chryseobacterium]|uniref:Glycosyltransferase n=1 Tax=Chryseobacterium rhizosphaerae TaxID=395937 RepID=A0ABX9IQB2_9FLAO|nr:MULTISPECIES: glycosyltransferase family 2 protein [Chryseobacterium]MDR6544433.1 glycosyltransferase involved in cell wall biosynthesis [Chryseobacterium rhizosphaerae]REC78179.1 glycosyltransferase [Chryseobacterium rhizosphaerae]GEN68906.1 glycosyl transferase [Chryseobacterium rhizosphaerae]SMC77373.1 Glycosyl transferase family 2 [Chryseobacterium sp. YR221]
MSPLISVIVPCYNQAIYLDECLQSVWDQTYTNWQCIIVNDGSTDHTEKTAKKWIEKDSRFIYVYKKNGGLSSARNAGLEKASGDYIQFLDSDDTIHSEKFTKSLSSGTEYSLMVSQFTIYKNQTHYPGYNRVKQDFLTFEGIVFGWDLKFSIPIHCSLISKNLLDGFLFDTSLTSCEDWLMWIYVMKDHPKVLLLEEPLAHYRKEDSNNSMSSDLHKILHQRIKILPILKKLYGDDLHDRLAYHIIEVRSSQFIQMRNEFNKVTGGKVISGYLALKKYYYKLFQKK